VLTAIDKVFAINKVKDLNKMMEDYEERVLADPDNLIQNRNVAIMSSTSKMRAMMTGAHISIHQKSFNYAFGELKVLENMLRQAGEVDPLDTMVRKILGWVVTGSYTSIRFGSPGDFWRLVHQSPMPNPSGTDWKTRFKRDKESFGQDEESISSFVRSLDDLSTTPKEDIAFSIGTIGNQGRIPVTIS
jgi:hypothetical protein